MIFASTELAARIERAECRLVTDGTRAASARHPDADVVVTGDNRSQLGTSVAAGLDYDGDGAPDLLAGAPKLDDGVGLDNGGVFLFSGDGLQSGDTTSALAQFLLGRLEGETAIGIVPGTLVSWDYRERMADC